MIHNTRSGLNERATLQCEYTAQLGASDYPTCLLLYTSDAKNSYL